MKTFLRILASIISWLTISPLMLLTIPKRALKRVWVWLMILVSPLFLIIYFIALIELDTEYRYIQRRYLSISESRLEKITGVKDFPDFKVVEYKLVKALTGTLRTFLIWSLRNSHRMNSSQTWTL